MLFRPVVSPTILRPQRLFHSSTICRADSPSHYETLRVPTNATAQEIKKSFYALSKASHPDHNPNDPDASNQFIKISEAYAVLGTPDRRQRYDRDVMRVSSHARAIPRGSYHSSGPAGGRPASGLSRRKTPFQGPPSFYRSGGWGSYNAKRQEAQGGTASRVQTAGDMHRAMGGGIGHGQHPYGWGGDVPHFDREGHFRTHTNYERRQQRRSESDIPSEPGNSMVTNFMLVSGILSVGLFVPLLLFDHVALSKKAN